MLRAQTEADQLEYLFSPARVCFRVSAPMLALGEAREKDMEKRPDIIPFLLPPLSVELLLRLLLERLSRISSSLFVNTALCALVCGVPGSGTQRAVFDWKFRND